MNGGSETGRHRSFRFKIYLTFSLFIAGMAVSVLYLFVRYQQEDLVKEIAHSGDMLSRMLADNAMIGVFSGNAQLVENSGVTTLKERYVKSVLVFDSQWAPLFRAWKEQTSSDVTEELRNEAMKRFRDRDTVNPGSIVIESGRFMGFWRPIMSANRSSSEEHLFGDGTDDSDSRAPAYTIGYAAVVLDKEELVSENRKVLITMITSIAAFILAGSFLLLVMVRRITGPLDRLTKRVLDIEREGRFALIDETGDWEVRKLTRAFNSMGAALEQKEAERREQEQMLIRQSSLAAMGGMLAAISHQWRQPLNAVAIMIQNIHNAYHKGILNTQYLDQTVEKTMEQIRFMSKTIDDFRAFIRPGMKRETFDVCASVDQTVSLLSATFRSHGMAVHVKKPDTCDGCMVSGFQSEFQQAVVNILNNAIDAILERVSGEEGAGRGNGEVSIEIVVLENDVEVRIDDNGRGLPNGAADRIFDPYFTTKEPGKGTGIGLYMARIIIEKNMNGRLRTESLPRGTRFTIDLPRERIT